VLECGSFSARNSRCGEVEWGWHLPGNEQAVTHAKDFRLSFAVYAAMIFAVPRLLQPMEQ
jgi:hypothetical protein